MENNTTLIRIQELCNQRGWTLYKLAQESGIAYSSLNNIFIRNTQPTIPTLEKICNGFKIKLSDFFADESTNSTLKSYVLSEDEEQLITNYRSVPKESKKIMKEFSTFLLHQATNY